MDINLAFTRLLLKGTMEVIKPLTTVAERKSVWVYHFNGDHWEFHGPGGFYWHGTADNAYDARHKGWEAWREKLRPVARTGRPMSRPERDIRTTNHMYWFGMCCGMLACAFPLYVLAIEVFVK